MATLTIAQTPNGEIVELSINNTYLYFDNINEAVIAADRIGLTEYHIEELTDTRLLAA